MVNYRVLKICGAGPFSPEFYDMGKLGEMSYEEQRGTFQSQNHPPPGSWSRCMSDLGNEATDVMINFIPIQKQWCRENNVSINFSEREWMFKLLCEHVRVYKPDVLFFYAGCFTWFSPDDRAALRTAYPFIKVIAGMWGDELSGQTNYGKAFGNVDVVFTSSTTYQLKFDNAGISAHLVGNCFDNLFDQFGTRSAGAQATTWDVTFIGVTGYRCDQHRQRYVDLVEIMKNTNMEIWTDEPDLKKSKVATRSTLSSAVKWPIKVVATLALRLMTDRQLKRIRETPWCNWTLAKYIDATLSKRRNEPVRGQFFINRLKISEMFPERCHRPLILGTDYYSLVANSKISLNRHRDERADAGNIRVFEATGLGSCLVTDRGREMKDFFIADKEIVTYESPDEAIEKIKYLLEHEEERMAIAEAGKIRTLTDHTVVNRCQKIHDVLEKLI